jgi:exosortase A
VSTVIDSVLRPAVVPTARSGWKRTLPAFLLVLAGVLIAFGDTFSAMVAIWERSETFMHAFCVPPIALWLIWRQREALVRLVPRPAPWVLPSMALVGFAWLLGDLAAVNAVTQFAAVALLVLTVPAMLGTAVARQLMFPLAFLFFMVPIGEFTIPQLMLWTGDFTVFALRLSGVPVYREGLQFVIPTGAWSVVDACSGVRYLIASLMVGTLFAYLNYTSMRRRLVFVAFAAAVPVVANWLRAYLIVMLGHLSGNRLAAGVDHLVYGWAFFGLVIVVMFAVGARWAQPPVSSGPIVTGLSPVMASPTSVWGAALVVLVLVALPHAAVVGLTRFDVATAPKLSLPDTLTGGWRRSADAPIWKPSFRNPSAESNVRYVDADGHEVTVYVGYYRRQDYERKLVSSDNMLVRSKDSAWSLVDNGTRVVTLAGGPALWRTARLRASAHAAESTDDGLAVWQTYWIDGALTASDSRAKLLGAWKRLRGRGDDGAVVMLFTRSGPTTDQQAAADAMLNAFARVHWPLIDKQLQKTRDDR